MRKAKSRKRSKIFLEAANERGVNAMKQDNRGLTLVELLIAVALLAVVVTPLFEAFYVSAKNNKKAGNTFRATTVAQNLMEGMEGYTLEEICGQFTKSALYRPDFSIYPKLPGDYWETDAAGTNRITSGQWKNNGTEWGFDFAGQTTNRYFFCIKGIEEGGVSYDARVILNASGYRYLTNPGASEADKEAAKKTSYNEDYLFSQDAMNAKKDVVNTYAKEEDAQGREKFIENLQIPPNFAGIVTIDNLKNDSVRTFRIVVDQDGATGKYKVSSQIDYGYRMPNATREFTRTVKLIEEVREDLRNVYVLYYPNYDSKQGAIKDRLVVESHIEHPFNVHLIKQIDPTLTQNELLLKEKDYQMQVFFYDVAVDNGNAANPQYRGVQLRTNMLTNMGEGGINKSLPDAIQFEYHSLQGASGAEHPNLASLTEERKKEIVGFVNGQAQQLSGEKREENGMFSITVEVYPSGTWDRNDFSRNNLLAVISSN